jgi:hypothetical protein
MTRRRRAADLLASLARLFMIWTLPPNDLALPTALTVIVVGVFFGVYGLILSDKFHKHTPPFYSESLTSRWKPGSVWS